MTVLMVHPVAGLRGQARVPGDKSISHRALLLGALASGGTHVEDFLPCNDCLATLECLRTLGVGIDVLGETKVAIHGRGLHGLTPPAGVLDCRRSATAMRLLAGVLAGQPFECTLSGDEQLLSRPMSRISEPLRQMGVSISDNNGCAPLTIRGGELYDCVHQLDVASAQVKSALLLAGLYADGPTTVEQVGPARDHTERMLRAMGANVESNDLTVTVSPAKSLAPLSMVVPGGISSAAFPIVAATIVPDSEITVSEVGINPTRTGLLDILRLMGADIAVYNKRTWVEEPVAGITARTSSLHGAEVSGDTVVRMIDEFSILAVAATQASGVTTVRDAGELRMKETDRVATLVEELGKVGADIEACEDGFVVRGPTQLHGGVVDSHSDHRLAMALAVAGMVADSAVTIGNIDCTADSFPGFTDFMRGIGGEYD